MAGEGEVRPIIIKRKKVIVGGGHHGGAWKVAYADFVTAMMAFFLLLWLLNATTEKQRKGLAEYFTPTIPVVRISGGGENAFEGNGVLSTENETRGSIGAENQRPVEGPTDKAFPPVSETLPSGQSVALDNDLARIEAIFNAGSGESEIADDLMEHIRTRVTDEGLIIEVFALESSPLFIAGTAIPTAKMRSLLAMIASVTVRVTNKIAVAGHTSSVPVIQLDQRGWEVSADRAQMVRTVLTRAGLPDARMMRIVGKADRELAVDNPLAVRNRRIEITLLRVARAGK